MIQSIHTTNLPALLQHHRISLFITTYQAGKVIIVRVDEGKINTHFRDIDKPMGMYVDQNRLIIGAKNEVLEYRNMPVLSERLRPKGKHDGCYVLRRRYITGDVDIHEITHAENEIHFVNTRFSAICNFDNENSFSPTWIPPFISRLAGEDRCHLNGFHFTENRLHYITALGSSNTAKGWRERKADGGILYDCLNKRFLQKDLCMPHSPRLYNGRLWLLESGKGELNYIDDRNQVISVSQLPGFTRGLAFHKSLAFVGISQLRGSQTLRNIPLETTCDDPQAGVWVVNIETGEIVAFLQFETGVEEIFSVAVLPGIQYPEILEHDHELLDNSYTIDSRYL